MRPFIASICDYFLSPLSLITWGFTVITLALSGPFGTFVEQSLMERFVYWAVVISIALAVAFVVRYVVRLVIPKLQGLLYGLFCGTIFACLFTPLLWGYSEWMSGGRTHEEMRLPLMFFTVLTISVGISALRQVLGMDPLDQEPRLVRRIEGYRGEGIARLTVDDHFVDVVTKHNRVHRIRLRFSDAVNEMEPVKGLCIHRSHWVAEDMLDCVIHEGTREILKLKDGTLLPIGKKYRPNLEVAGLI
jgi:hypothetical protein